MKFIKQFIILIVALFSIILITALFVKKDYQVTRSTTIERNNSDIFEFIRHLDNFESYVSWDQKDTEIQRVISGIDGNIGAKLNWNSKVKDIGSGQLEIVDLVNNKNIDYLLKVERPIAMNINSSIVIESNENSESSIVTWNFNGSNSWPWNIILLFKDPNKELGPELEKGLKNLKDILEMAN